MPAPGSTSQPKRQTQPQTEQMEDDTPKNGKQKKAGIALLILDKADFKIRKK